MSLGLVLVGTIRNDAPVRRGRISTLNLGTENKGENEMKHLMAVEMQHDNGRQWYEVLESDVDEFVKRGFSEMGATLSDIDHSIRCGACKALDNK
jgi:hypothetical protein